jgi:hypothetical protein
MVMDNDVDAFLEHFGVKGMRWGVLNKDSSANTSTEKAQTKQQKRSDKTQKHVDKAAAIQKEIDKLDKNPGKTKYDKAVISVKKQELTQDKKEALDAAEATRQGKLTDKQKTVIKGVAIAGGILLAYGAYNAAQSGKMHSMAMEGKAFLSGKGVASWKTNPNLAAKDLTPDAIMDSVVRPINPGFGGIGTKQNCRRATYAYEMRRRGYDVSATRTTNAKGQEITGVFNALNPDVGKDVVGPGRLGVISRLAKEGLNKSVRRSSSTPFTDKVKETAKSRNVWGEEKAYAGADGIFHSLATQPNGARGELGMGWRGGGGHSMSWEKINGQIHIFDNQSGKHYSSVEEFDGIAQNIATAGFTRLDNKPLNQAFLRRWLKDA